MICQITFQLKWKVIFDELNDIQKGKLAAKILNYMSGVDADSEDEDIIRVAFATIRDSIDKEVSKKTHISKVRAEAGRKGGMKSGVVRSKNLPTKKQFHPPTLSEITEYVTTKNLNVIPADFYNYYGSTDWKVGKKPMTNWRYAVQHWHSNNTKTNESSKKPQTQKEYLS